MASLVRPLSFVALVAFVCAAPVAKAAPPRLQSVANARRAVRTIVDNTRLMSQDLARLGERFNRTLAFGAGLATVAAVDNAHPVVAPLVAGVGFLAHKAAGIARARNVARLVAGARAEGIEQGRRQAEADPVSGTIKGFTDDGHRT